MPDRVVTMQPERPPDRPHCFRAEDRVVEDRLPLELVLEDGSLTQAVGQLAMALEGPEMLRSFGTR